MRRWLLPGWRRCGALCWGDFNSAALLGGLLLFGAEGFEVTVQVGPEPGA
jgi:hypothetical protein